MSSFLIETNQLVKKFGKFTAVDHIDLQVPKGGIYGFLGPNGAGKSTTIRMLLGLIKPTSGSVKLFGMDINTNRIEILKKIGSIVEYPSNYGNLTAEENLEITRKILDLKKADIDRVLKLVRLEDVRSKKVKKFSLGMKQRLGIAQALMGNPELLILDEPTNGLDPAGIHEIRDLIKSLPAKMGITVLVSSHILSEIELMATHVGIINNGKMTFQGTLDELKEKSISKIKLQTDNDKVALKFLKEQGYNMAIEDHSLLVLDRGVNPAAINRELVTKGFQVSHVSQNKTNLEDLFLDLTREGK